MCALNEFSFTDEALREPALLITDAMLAAIPVDSEHEFSPGFQAKMQKLLRRARQKAHSILRRVAVIFLAFLLSAGTWLAVDTDAQAAFARWTLEVFGDSAVYRFFCAPDDDTIPDYRLTWFPEEYTVLDANKSSDSNVIVYGGDQSAAMFYYHLLSEDRYMVITSLSGEELKPEPVTINGASGEFYDLSADGLANTLAWVDGDANLVFAIEAFTDRDTMIRMAESMEPGSTPSPFPYYRPAWLPDGYRKNGERSGFQNRTTDFCKEDMELSFTISLAEQTQLSDVFGLDMSAEGLIALEINGDEGVFVPGEDGTNRLCWLDINTGVALELTAQEDLETLQRIAKQIVQVD